MDARARAGIAGPARATRWASRRAARSRWPTPLRLAVARRRVDACAGGVARRPAVVLSAGRALLAPAAGDSPLNAELGEQRRLAVARPGSLTTGGCATRGGTVNDVVLAVVAGALRGWLLSRGEPLRAGAATVRRWCRSSVTRDADGRAPAGRASEPGRPPCCVDLPVGEPNPLLRLAQVGYAMPSAPGVRPVGRRRRAGRADGLRAADPARARRPGRQRPDPAAVQPGRHQRARPAGAAVRRGRPDDRDVPGRAAGAGAGAVDRR